ncbi:MAG TPA: hypothetical protein VEY10_03685 [Flavisolibacter sp.]|nr:hypothetical protein [Flavisolibacter sp.]
MSKDERRTAIEKAVIAISKYDTSQLYKLVDTGRCFNIYSKEGFLDKVDYVYRHLKDCSNQIVDSTIRIEKEQPYYTKYIIPFCSAKEQAKNDSFSLTFSFADYRKDGVIDFMDVIVRREIKNSTMPVPTEN